MINVFCHTNLDNPPRIFDIKWPVTLCCRPQVGDYICAVNHDYSLKVVRITHVPFTGAHKDTPGLRIELNR